MATPWNRIRTEWLKGGVTYRELAEKYHISEKTISNRSSNEGWGKEKGTIREEVREKTRAHIVRVREEQLEKLAAANGAIIDALMDMAMMAKNNPASTLYDNGKTLRNAESLSKAIQLAVQTQRDIFRLPDMDMELRKKELAQKKRLDKQRMELEREKWEAEKMEKAKAQETASGTVWEVIEPDGEDTDA